MGERARRSRDGSSRYTIDMLFPGLQNSSSSTFPLEPETDGLESIQGRPIRSLHKTTTASVKNEQDGGPGDDPNFLGQEEGKESNMNNEVDVCNSGPLLRGSSSKSMWPGSRVSGGRIGGSKRKSGSPLKPATQPKQMYPSIGLTKLSRKAMFEAFQPWILQTYGDSAKTKTITSKKYNRIVKTLRGEEINNIENSKFQDSKFRFWTKSKGAFFCGSVCPLPSIHYSHSVLCNLLLILLFSYKFKAFALDHRPGNPM